MFVAAGLNHFRDPAFYAAMMPPAIPWPAFWVAFTGVAEVAGGVGLLIPRLRRAAGVGLVLMLVGFVWVHVDMLARPPLWDGRPVPAAVLWLRLLMQFPLTAWVWWMSRPPVGDV